MMRGVWASQKSRILIGAGETTQKLEPSGSEG